VQDWIEAIETWPEPDSPLEARERELLQVRSRDVLEHIERVVHHVRRLEQSVETAVQMHFSVQGSRTNDIMRTSTGAHRHLFTPEPDGWHFRDELRLHPLAAPAKRLLVDLGRHGPDSGRAGARLLAQTLPRRTTR